MRLDSTERSALHHAINGFDGDVYLYGSRVDDQRRGGDIDILMDSKQIITDKIKFSSHIRFLFQSICDERIDILVIDSSNREEHATFIASIERDMEKINDIR
jgi:uncharacterized protein